MDLEERRRQIECRMIEQATTEQAAIQRQLAATEAKVDLPPHLLERAVLLADRAARRPRAMPISHRRRRATDTSSWMLQTHWNISHMALLEQARLRLADHLGPPVGARDE